ncbi:MAG: hypothetical protein KIT72_09870 [Polyangiaceae bacterium]|nr:hypothetical protein [Polyangiaceae bacterium]MCW5790716.1 hypothetical protein [Polyangiaceae bacterium]
MRSQVTCLSVWGALLAAGCYPPGDGAEPPLDRIYFPVGVAVSPDQSQLLVVNSDFDLQFNAGSFQVFDLTRLRELARETHDAEGCGALGERSVADRALTPGRCRAVSPTSPPGGGTLLQESISIGAFATDILLRERFDDGDDPATPERELTGCQASVGAEQGDCAEGVCRPWVAVDASEPGVSYRGYCAVPRGFRVFIPVRGDATLHFIDSQGGDYDCGQRGASGACDDNHRRGDDPQQENTRGLRMPPEPYGIAASADSEAIVVSHQSEGRASLFVNSWVSGPRLEFVVDGLPSGAVGVAASPEPLGAQLSGSRRPSFLMSFRNSPSIELLRYFDDTESSVPRPFLNRSGSVPITINSLSFDSRGIGVDATRRQQCEARCVAAASGVSREALEEQLGCLEDCVTDVSLDVYVANRSPASLLRGQTREDGSELPLFYDSLVLSPGPSRVVQGEVLARCSPTQAAEDPCRRREARLFVLCFDSRKLYVVQPTTGRVESVIQTGRGPHAFATDVSTAGASHALGYLAHFTDSYIGVLDLDQGSPSYGTFIANLGTPTPPRASK